MRRASRFIILAAIVSALIVWRAGLHVGPAPTREQVAAALDLGKYRTEDSAQAAFDALFPNGQRSDELIAQLGQHFDLIGVRPLSAFASLYAFDKIEFRSYRRIVEDGGRGSWTIGLMHTRSGRILRTEVHRFFDGDAFPRTGLPFRFDYFDTDRDANAALLGVIESAPTLDRVERLLADAGARSMTKVSRDGRTTISYHYVVTGRRDIISSLNLITRSWIVSGHFGPRWRAARSLREEIGDRVLTGPANVERHRVRVITKYQRGISVPLATSQIRTTSS
jgi:hypothetical protein